MSDTLTDKQAQSAILILERRFRKPPKKARSRADNLHPVVDFLFDEIGHFEMTDAELTNKAGLSINVLNNWRNGRGPQLAKLEHVLNLLGYTLVAVPLPETKE